MFFTGIADEAADAIEGQIAAIRQIGWRWIELRNINGRNITDISDAEFEHAARSLEAAGLGVNAFASTIANWGKSILESPESSLAEARRAIPRMKRLGVRHVRIMSFGILRDRPPHDQLVDERVRRLRDIVSLFADEGLQALHENCANYGGMGWPFTLELVEKVPGLKLVFDTANPATTLDRTRSDRRPQSSWEFYKNARPHIAHVHIKDARFLGDDPGAVFEKADYCWPGEGEGDVRRIVSDLLATGYDGGLSIEPHLSVVYHDANTPEPNTDARFHSFIEYGRRLETIAGEAASATGK
jgi:sugar phosphate isomerase/epimerase